MPTEAAKPRAKRPAFRFLGEEEFNALSREERDDYVRDAVRAILREIPVVKGAPKDETS